jgi:hypothetical protein
VTIGVRLPVDAATSACLASLLNDPKKAHPLPVIHRFQALLQTGHQEYPQAVPIGHTGWVSGWMV